MIKKRLVMVICFGMIIMHCEDKTDVTNVGNNCGLETTFIKDIDNIDELGNASGSAIKMLDDCSYVGVGHRAGVPWVTKFNESGEQVWDKIFDDTVPQG